jgi:spore protease
MLNKQGAILMPEEWEVLFDKYNVRTDLALEAHQTALEHGEGPNIPGLMVETEDKPHVKVSRVEVSSAAAAQTIGKSVGTYVTLEAPSLRTRNKDEQEEISQQLALEIQAFLDRLQIKQDGSCLVVGLGNWNATPDALGPKVVSDLLVTRHLYEMSPPELRGELRPVAAVAPGVLGLTGIETGEIVKGIVDRLQPSLVICIDALAARNVERLCTTIQLSDTGISPGAGVGNRRTGINQESLGVPVLAIGVPTVIHAINIVGDAMEWMASQIYTGSSGNMNIPDTAYSPSLDPARIQVMRPDSAKVSVRNLSNEQKSRTDQFGLPLDPVQKRFMVNQFLKPFMGEMIVTPKEIDALVDDVAECIAGGINTALHPSIDLDEIFRYLQG